MEESESRQIEFNYKNILIVFLVVIVGIAGFIFLSLSYEKETQEVSEEAEVLSEGGGDEMDGLITEDIVVGEGKEAKEGDTVSVHYVGKLIDGTLFDSSLERDESFEFTLGTGQVIEGWDKGVIGMKIGGKRKLVIPPALGYGERGTGDTIPPNATS